MGAESSRGGTERRMVFMHNGKFRSIASTECPSSFCAVTMTRAPTGKPNVRPSGGSPSSSTSKSSFSGSLLLSERISKTKISKSHGDTQKCKLWLYTFLPVLIMVLIAALPLSCSSPASGWCSCSSTGWLAMMCCLGLFKLCFAPKTFALSAEAEGGTAELEQLIVEETDNKNDMSRVDL